MLPPFEVVARRRPVEVVAPGPDVVALREDEPSRTPRLAPYAAVHGDGSSLRLALESGDDRLEAVRGDGAIWLEVSSGERRTTHRSRRFGSVEPGAELGLTLTGAQLTAFSRHAGGWTARARVDLSSLPDPPAVRDERWLADLRSRVVGGSGTAGRFGQLGLRDTRLVTRADGTPYGEDEDWVLFTATSAGPGFFDTGHTSVWALARDTLQIRHRADLFFRRPDRPGAYGDHATHLLREDGEWLVATSTWGDFDRTASDASVGVSLARSRADLLSGAHLLDTERLALPVDGLTSVGVWDPHLVRSTDEPAGWLVGYVSATRFFRFHPVLASGPSLDALTLRAAATSRRATEGTTLAWIDGAWRVLASDGRDGRAGAREQFAVLDLDLADLGALEAPYPSNIPWPTIVRDGEDWLMITFDGRPATGRLPGYGTHGDLVVMRSSAQLVPR